MKVFKPDSFQATGEFYRRAYVGLTPSEFRKLLELGSELLASMDNEGKTPPMAPQEQDRHEHAPPPSPQYRSEYPTSQQGGAAAADKDTVVAVEWTPTFAAPAEVILPPGAPARKTTTRRRRRVALVPAQDGADADCKENAAKRPNSQEGELNTILPRCAMI